MAEANGAASNGAAGADAIETLLDGTQKKVLEILTRMCADEPNSNAAAAFQMNGRWDHVDIPFFPVCNPFQIMLTILMLTRCCTKLCMEQREAHQRARARRPAAHVIVTC